MLVFVAPVTPSIPASTRSSSEISARSNPNEGVEEILVFEHQLHVGIVVVGITEPEGNDTEVCVQQDQGVSRSLVTHHIVGVRSGSCRMS